MVKGQLQAGKVVFRMMKYITNTTDFHIEEDTVISLGKFDGIHRGHELLLEHFSDATKKNLAKVIFTFDVPPRQNVSQLEAKVLTTNEEKMHVFEKNGIDYLVECPFTPQIMCMEPEDFIEKIVRQLHVKCMVVGEDFRFGHKRRGDYRMLQAYQNQYGYEVIVIEKRKEDGRDISSTFVREEIAAGHIEKANRLLGYQYFVTGMVKHGNQIGRTLGIPTINQIPPKEKLLPPNGVYVTETVIEGKRYKGITNVGCKPTIAGEHPIGVETHLLDFWEDVYEKAVVVEFLSRVRDELQFSSIDALKEQMKRDIAYVREWFAAHTTASKHD